MNACRKRSMTLRSFKARSFLLEIKGCRGVRRGSWAAPRGGDGGEDGAAARPNLRSEEHTSELQVTNAHLVCRLLLEKKNKRERQDYYELRTQQHNTTNDDPAAD